MRKGSKFGKSLEVYTRFNVEGVNLDNLINTLVKKGITVVNAKKQGNNRISFAIKSSEVKNFFAISKDLCYTKIERVKEYGKSYPILFFYKNFGLILGAIVFIAVSLFFKGYVFSFSFSGTGSVLRREVSEYLSDNGVTPFTDIKNVDLAKLSDGILKSNPRLTFAECKKEGFTLKVELALAENGTDGVIGFSDKLVSDVDGVVSELKVYRGTPVVGVGDKVKSGDIIVEGFATVKDQRVEVSVIAYAVIESESVYKYVSDKDGEEDVAEIFAREQLFDKEICQIKTYKTLDNGKYVYSVKTTYKTVLYSK